MISCYDLKSIVRLIDIVEGQTKDRLMRRDDPKQHHRKRNRKRSVYFFLLNRLKRFSLSFSRLPGLDSAAVVTAATEAGSVWARGAGAGADVLWLLGVTSGFSPTMAAEILEIQLFISSCETRNTLRLDLKL